MAFFNKAFDITIAGGLLGTSVVSIDEGEVFISSLDTGLFGLIGNQTLPYGSLNSIETTNKTTKIKVNSAGLNNQPKKLTDQRKYDFFTKKELIHYNICKFTQSTKMHRRRNKC